MKNLHNSGKKVRQNTQIYMDMIDEYSESAEKIHNKIKKGIPEKSKSDNEKEREKIVRQIER